MKPNVFTVDFPGSSHQHLEYLEEIKEFQFSLVVNSWFDLVPPISDFKL